MKRIRRYEKRNAIHIHTLPVSWVCKLPGRRFATLVQRQRTARAERCGYFGRSSAETVTRATSTFTAPTASELTYKVTDTQTGEVVYNQTGEFTSLVLDEGFYRLEASYGTENMGTAPYLYAATEEFRITTATETAKSLSVKLSCAIVHPAIADNLLEHYDTYKIEISDGTSIREIPNNADFFCTGRQGLYINIIRYEYFK